MNIGISSIKLRHVLVFVNLLDPGNVYCDARDLELSRSKVRLTELAQFLI
jgi:hypothetical protein